ncbi:hypothetical protein MTO96_040101 [Rhipicephalus appendiculatus]
MVKAEPKVQSEATRRASRRSQLERSSHAAWRFPRVEEAPPANGDINYYLTKNARNALVPAAAGSHASEACG